MTGAAPDDIDVPAEQTAHPLLEELAALLERASGTDLDAEQVRYLLRFLQAGIRICMEHDDTDHPSLCNSIEHGMTWGLDNPDCSYRYTRLRGDATYRLIGQLGTACHLELQVNTGHHGDGDYAGWRCVSALSRDELHVQPDGGFEVQVGGEPKAGNWMALDPDASFLLVREYFADWESERPSDLQIERLGAELPPPPLDRQALASRLGLLVQWLRTGSRCWDELSRGILASEPGQIQPFLPPDHASGLGGQAYGMGPFRCAPGEAVILELEPPRSRLWSISLCDRYWQSIDFANRQSSLNSTQSALTDDGRFIAVISQVDPGIANWLDPGGNREGTIAVRYLLADSLPAVSYRSVPFDDLPSQLPEGTPRTSVAERREVLRRRRLAVQRRMAG